MDKELLTKSETLLEKLEDISKFESRHHIFPPKKTGELVTGFDKLADSIQDIPHPIDQEEVWLFELKKGLQENQLILKRF